MLYEAIVKRLLTESKLDFLANKVSRATMKKIVSSVEEINRLPKTKQGNFIVRNGNFIVELTNDAVQKSPKKILLNLVFKILHTINDKTSVEASWDWKTNELTVFVTIQSTTSKLEPIHFNMIRPFLHNAIRHELEHSSQSSELAVSAIQSGYEMIQDKKDIEKKKKYYTDPAEIPAFIAGARQQSKKEKRSFYEIINDMLEKIKKSFIHHGIEDQASINQAIEEIRNKWILYAEENYPGIKTKFIK